MKTKKIKKMLAASAACIVLSTSFAGGTIRVWAEQYYGYNDGTRDQSPFFLYVTPKENPRRELTKESVVYCFNRNKHWPDNWEKNVSRPLKLPLYDKVSGTKELFEKEATKFRKVADIKKSLVAILSKGYPNNNLSSYGISKESARKVTQLAIWYFSDSIDNPETSLQKELTNQELEALRYLVSIGQNPTLSESEEKKTLDLYIYKNGGGDYNDGKPYQNLLGSTLIPKTPEKPKENKPKDPESPKDPEKPEVNLEIEVPKKPGEPLKDPNVPDPNIPENHTPKPEGPKDDNLEISGGNSQIIDTVEDTGTGVEGGSQNGVISTQENSDPIVETTQDTQPSMSGQSGDTTTTEDTKKPDTIIGGQDQVVETTQDTQPGMSGQSGNTTTTEDTKKPDTIIGGQDQVVETTQDTQPGMSGQSGNTTTTEDTKKPDTIIGGQDQVVETTQDTQPGMSGQSGNTTTTEDTKKPDTIIGGQDQVVETTQDTQPGMSGQSGNTTTTEDTKNPERMINKGKAIKGSILPQTGDKQSLHLSILGIATTLIISFFAIFKRSKRNR